MILLLIHIIKNWNKLSNIALWKQVLPLKAIDKQKISPNITLVEISLLTPNKCTYQISQTQKIYGNKQSYHVLTSHCFGRTQHWLKKSLEHRYSMKKYRNQIYGCSCILVFYAKLPFLFAIFLLYIYTIRTESKF